MAVASLKPGDTIVCHLKEGRIVSSYAAFDDSQDFQIIATDPSGYYLYIPDHIFVAGTIKIDSYTARSLGIRPQFIDCNMFYIEGTRIVSVRSQLDGCLCARCNEFFPMAEPNQEDGTMLCFLCRTYRWR